MIIINDLQGDDWTGWKFENKKDLKDFLQGESAVSSGFDTIEEYYKENAHVSLDEYCEMYQIEYEEVSDE